LKKKTYSFLLLFFITTFIVISQYNINVNANVSASNFSIYIIKDKSFSFQLTDNITQFLTLNAINSAFNVTGNSLVMQEDEGEFHFTSNENSTIRINHNMDVVTIEIRDILEETLLGNNSSFDIYKDNYVSIIFKIKGIDISGVFTQIVFFVLSVVGLIITPPISDIVSKNDKMQQIFIWVCGWLFFGMLFFVWIYAW